MVCPVCYCNPTLVKLSFLGRIVSAHLYRLRIERIIEHIAQQDYAKENSHVIAEYMDKFPNIIGFLRTLSQPDLNDPELLRVTRKVMETQETIAEGALRRLNYGLESETLRRIMMDTSTRNTASTLEHIENKEERTIDLNAISMEPSVIRRTTEVSNRGELEVFNLRGRSYTDVESSSSMLSCHATPLYLPLFGSGLRIGGEHHDASSRHN